MPSSLLYEHHFRLTLLTRCLDLPFGIRDSTDHFSAVRTVPRNDLPIVLLLQHIYHVLFAGIEVQSDLFSLVSCKRKTGRNECIEYPYSTDSFTPGTRLSLAEISRVLSRSQ